MNEEIWKDIIGYEGMYMVSNHGKVKSLSRLKKNGPNSFEMTKDSILRPGLAGAGYPFVQLCIESKNKANYIHRLVAIHFIPNPENKSDINHLDGDKTNNNDWNLAWSTKSENTNHAVINKLIPVGIANYNARLTEEEVASIRKDPRTNIAIGSEYGVSHSLISNIKLRKTWKHLN